MSKPERQMQTDTAADPDARRHWRVSLSGALMLLFSGLVFLAVAGVLGIGLWSARENTLSLLADKAEAGMNMMASRLGSHFAPPMAQAEYLAGLVANGTLDPGDQDRLIDFMTAAMAGSPQVRGLAFINPRYDVLRLSRQFEKLGVSLVNWEDDARTRVSLDEARGRSTPYWGELFYSGLARETLINLRVPLRRDGEFLGVLLWAVAISDLSRFITTLTGPAAGTNFILYGAEHVMAHKALTGKEFALSDRQPLPRIGQVGDSVIAAIWDKGARSDLLLPLKGETRGHLVTRGEERHVVLYRQLNQYGEVPWTIGAYFRDDGSITPELKRLANATFTGLGVLVLSILVALALGRRIGRPVRELAIAAQDIAELDFDHIPTLRKSRMRELDDAASAFNRMISGLKWFQTYVPRPLVRRLMEHDDGYELPSEEREITILFTDIVGFTALSQDSGAAEIAAMLNEHFALVAASVDAEHGTLDKYVGDSVMAFWGAPMSMSNHAERACAAAIDIRKCIIADNATRIAEGRAPIFVRIGIHTGKAIVGNIGAPGRVNYTLVGDTVNVAQRLQELAKDIWHEELQVGVLISDETKRQIGSAFPISDQGIKAIRGRHGDIRTWSL